MKNSFLKYFLIAPLVMLSALPASAEKKIKIGVIQLTAPYAVEIEDSLHKTLNSLGYRDEVNLDYMKRIGEAEVVKYGANRKIANELMAAGADVIVTIGTGASTPVWPLIKGKTTQQVFVGVTYPVQGGLIKKYGQATGENITGISYGVPIETRLKIFRTIFPDQTRFKKLAFIYSSVLEQEINYVNELKKLKTTYGFDFIFIDFYNPATKTTDFTIVENKAAEVKPDILFGWYSLDDLCNKAHLRDRVMSLPIPIMAITSNFTDQGAIGGILTNHFQLGAQGAEMVHRILAGTPAAEIPPEEPREYLLEINLKRARELKIDIPQEAIKMAYRVVY